jgi:eukaryotic-like serine/threonine-protein kinase
VTPRPSRPWPSANAYSQALQNPSTAFQEPLLRTASVARDRLGMPLVMSGNFAYVFKLDLAAGGSRAVKCFRRALGDREPRFQAIDRHLEQLAMEDVARFEFEAQGVLVEGTWYPALVMEWVDGPTLDVYVGELLRGTQAPQALRDLAAQWGQLVAKLEDAGIAHGDLQHGNVIVTPGGLRLVDLDGMYVPALCGRGAPDEVGHRHYQHPGRTVADFDERLDRFASLVIHLSLLALAEEPSLWTDFHDDNLVLERADFLRPDASAAFRRLAAHGGDVARLADVLRGACGRPLAEVPALTTLVEVMRSKLPLWLRQPVVPTVEKRTREAAPGDIAAPTPAGPPPAQPVPWQAVPRTSPSLPGGRPPLAWAAPPSAAPTPPAPARAPVLGPAVSWPAPVQTPAAWPPPQELPPLRVGVWVGGSLAFFGLGCMGLWKEPLDRVVGALGATPGSGWAGFLVCVLYLGCAAAAGWAASKVIRRDGSLRLPPMPRLLRHRPQSPAFYVASSLLGVFHRPDCPLARRIGIRNRVWLQHAYEAQAGGFQACLFCRP